MKDWWARWNAVRKEYGILVALDATAYYVVSKGAHALQRFCGVISYRVAVQLCYAAIALAVIGDLLWCVWAPSASVVGATVLLGIDAILAFSLTLRANNCLEAARAWEDYEGSGTVPGAVVTLVVSNPPKIRGFWWVICGLTLLMSPAAIPLTNEAWVGLVLLRSYVELVIPLPRSKSKLEEWREAWQVRPSMVPLKITR